MITIFVLDSPDLVSLGEHIFPFENVKIGLKLKNSLVIDDKSIKDEVISLSLTKDHLFLNSKNFIKLNNKKIKGKLRLKIGDKISIGQTTLRIENFDCSKIESNDEYYNALEQLSKEDPDSYAVIEFFENEYARKLGTINVMEE